MKVLTRREMLEKAIVRGSLIAGASMTDAELLRAWPTPNQARKLTNAEVLGPFYRKGAPDEGMLRRRGDPGFALRVAGTVFNTRGEALPDARVELWQTNHAGYYDIRGHRYRASLAIDEQASYTVETVMPGTYPDRPARHIHYMISAPGHQTLVTQAYFETDPWFEGDIDKNVRKRNIVQNRELVRPVTLFGAAEGARGEITFDIVLERL